MEYWSDEYWHNGEFFCGITRTLQYSSSPEFGANVKPVPRPSAFDPRPLIPAAPRLDLASIRERGISRAPKARISATVGELVRGSEPARFLEINGRLAGTRRSQCL